ncbi:hypothetical protein [Rubrivirga sp.]|uniref:hypothetical protein n=1 Tax=Rubrivirga sp. TaxID=1885344 RepID=UPI003B51BAA5
MVRPHQVTGPTARYRSLSSAPSPDVRFVALVVLLVPLLAGCVYTRPASLASPADRAEVNARAERGHPVLALAGERGRQVRALRVGPDTTTWVDKRTGEARSAPTSDVTAVSFRRDGAGALKGAAIGATAGALLYYVIAHVDPIPLLPPRLAAGLGAVAAAPFGALAGAAVSERHVYRVVPEPEVARAGPPCGGPPLACAAPAHGAGR